MELRNIALIAHVDHGKTTLVDSMFRAAGAIRANQRIADRALDSGDQERERGITILAKCTAVLWRGTKINIVDTPGHADFGGEVERILSMVDGALLLVDAAEGPMPQTKFVLAKALGRGLAPIVVINKVDRRDGRPHAVVDAVFDLFAALGADERQLDFPILYASAREGWAAREIDAPRAGMEPLFDAILNEIAPPLPDPGGAFAMLASILEYDAHLGRVLTGRIARGTAEVNMPVTVLNRDGDTVEQSRMTKLLTFNGLARVPARRVSAGDIVAIAGLKTATVADTVAAAERPVALSASPVDPPTLAMRFTINDSPLAGNDGDKVTSRLLRDRLFREAESNVAIDLSAIEGEDGVEVRGRGELQLGVLIETLRREGFELSVSRPRVLYRVDPATGARLEPLEEVIVDVDDGHVGVVVESLGRRRGEMSDMRPSGGGKTRIGFIAPSRGLIGFLGELMNDTRGTGAMSRVFHGYGPHRGPMEDRRRGVLISTGDGEAVEYALRNLEERGVLFVEPGERVYRGMIVGEHSRGNDLEVNPLRTKQLTNIRAAGKDDAIRLTPARRLRLEEAISYIAGDELVEVTPRSIRLRKTLLDPHARRRASRGAG
ncbi:MAG: translational GTPase TypA [Defluviicoccus sp.]|nr:translational GTPase TypA [Defluviicoccus sp.]MDE0386924.1 translational GTPase TypA [Defluviicoccus sp.]